MAHFTNETIVVISIITPATKDTYSTPWLAAVRGIDAAQKHLVEYFADIGLVVSQTIIDKLMNLEIVFLNGYQITMGEVNVMV